MKCFLRNDGAQHSCSFKHNSKNIDLLGIFIGNIDCRYIFNEFLLSIYILSHGIRETVSFDNAAYTKDGDESFDAAETSFNSNNSTEECPKWAKGYDRARQLYERNRNVPAGRLFDFHNLGGETSQI